MEWWRFLPPAHECHHFSIKVLRSGERVGGRRKGRVLRSSLVAALIGSRPSAALDFLRFEQKLWYSSAWTASTILSDSAWGLPATSFLPRFVRHFLLGGWEISRSFPSLSATSFAPRFGSTFLVGAHGRTTTQQPWNSSWNCFVTSVFASWWHWCYLWTVS